MTSFKSINSVIYTPNDVTVPLVVTYDNKFAAHPNSHFFQQTLESHDWQYLFVSINDEYRNHMDKMLGYKAALETLNPEKIVILSDARDVVCCRNVKAFMEAFRSIGESFIVSMELFCNTTTDTVFDIAPACVPLVTYWKERTNGVYPLRKYVNSGLMVGKVKPILEFLNYTIDKHFSDDQVALGAYMNEYPKKVYADIDRILLHSTTFGKSAGCENMHLQKQDAPTYGELFGRDSFFLHFPGCGFNGQKLIYEMTKFLISNHYTSKKLNNLYELSDPAWNERPFKSK